MIGLESKQQELESKQQELESKQRELKHCQYSLDALQEKKRLYSATEVPHNLLVDIKIMEEEIKELHITISTTKEDIEMLQTEIADWESYGLAEEVEAVSGQVLKLDQSDVEDYTRDFFKDYLKNGGMAAKSEVAKKAAIKALKAFLLLIEDELEDQELSKSGIRNRYEQVILQFIKDESAKSILSKAFEMNCKSLEVTQLAAIWRRSTLKGKLFPTMPEGFDWQRVSNEYRRKVRRIVREDSELRSLLEKGFLENIAYNTTKISPGFDVIKYRDSLQCSYGYLKLYVLDSTDHTDAIIKLWNMFIEQTVRESLPPMLYELPLDLKRQLQARGQLETDLSPEALELYRDEYFQQPLQEILDVVANTQRAVILGDPGSGKSTLLQYLALEWVEGKTEILPLLIELREYANAQSANFLEFLHCGRGVDWQFDKQQLHQHLQNHTTLVMFDGLDEVFDRITQGSVLDDIIRFTQKYPKVRVLVTSRIIGYNPERFRHAKFNHFTIQPLDNNKIHEFIDRWYTLALGDDPDKSWLAQRLKDAITNFKAIQNLADNPLLLTMMAILNRRQELPRYRAELYDQASRVLLYHWDVDHKRLQLPIDTIGRREKQEMLRLIAYEMQAGEEGLKGNLINIERLIQILTDYLRGQGFTEPREKANVLIQQLRERNFILCYRGADTYGFLHRTFLEYFCATEVVHRFEKQRTLSFEELRDTVFGQHWQKDTWHEVLRLICGMIDARFVGKLIDWMIHLEVDKSQFLEEDFNTYIYMHEYDYLYNYPLKKEGLSNLLLAAKCLAEVKNRVQLGEIDDNLLSILKQEIEIEPYAPLSWETAGEITSTVANVWHGRTDVLNWLQVCVDKTPSYIPSNVVKAVSNSWKGDVEVLDWLRTCADHSNWRVSTGAMIEIARTWKEFPGILPWLKTHAQTPNVEGRGMAVQELSLGWKDDPEVFQLLKQLVKGDDWDTRGMSVRELTRNWKDDPELLPLFKAYAQNDPNEFVRREAISALAENWKDDPEVIYILKMCAQADEDSSVRKRAILCLSSDFKDDVNTLPWLKECVQSNEHWATRSAAIQALAEDWKEEPELLSMVNASIQDDCSWQVRKTAIATLSKNWKDATDTFPTLIHIARHDESADVRYQAIQELIKHWKKDTETFDLLCEVIVSDPFTRENDTQYNPRFIALQAISRFYPGHQKTLKLLHEKAEYDSDKQLQNWAQKQWERIQCTK